MTERAFHSDLVLGLCLLAGLVLVVSLFVTAPYGRHPRTRWSGPDMPSWLGWMLMELPQPAGFVTCFLLGERRTELVALVFLGMWMFHYTYRTLIYPFLPRASSMSLSVVAMGFLLNCCFSYVNGRWLFSFGPQHPTAWLIDPRFLLGALLFFGGFALCSSSDSILRRLRAPRGERTAFSGRSQDAERGHRIPQGGAFRWVTAPNYLGEITQWCGWTLATWSMAGLTIALITIANLVPRALANHRWSRQRFPDYPSERRALIPYLL